MKKQSQTKETVIYRIRNSNGLYSDGSSYPSFSKIGKLFTSKSALKGHITWVTNHDSLIKKYIDCEVVASILADTVDEEMSAHLVEKKFLSLDK